MNTYLEQNDHPVIITDIIVLNDKDQVLLTQRNVEPQKGFWSIVAERINIDDNSIEHAVKRNVREECNINVKVENLVDVLANPRFDPPADSRFYAVQVLYVARMIDGVLKETVGVSGFVWVDLDEAIKMNLAFNHVQLLKIYKEKKNGDKLIPIERTKFIDYYGKPFSYVNNAFPRIAIDNIILNNKNEILLARRSQWPFVGHWDFPGGHIYVGEGVKDCAKREAKEELGVDVEVGELFHVYSDRGQSPKFMNIVAFFFSKIIDDNYNFEKNIEMDDFNFFPLDQLPDKIAYHHDRALIDLRKYFKIK